MVVVKQSAHPGLVEFHRRRPRECRNDLDRYGHLIRDKPVAKMGKQDLCSRLSATLQLDNRNRHLTKPRICQPKDKGLIHGVMLLESVGNNRRHDLEPTPVDSIIGAAVNEQEIIVINRGEI